MGVEETTVTPLHASPYTVAACRPGRAGGIWAQAALRTADSYGRLPLEIHRYLASHPDPGVRRYWAERPDTPAPLVSARLAVESDRPTFNRLLTSTTHVPADPAQVLALEGRGALVARAMNSACPDEEAAAYLSTALPLESTRRSERWTEVAIRYASMWRGRPAALAVLLSRSSESWALRQVAPFCSGRPELERLLVDRVGAVIESPSEVLNVLLSVPLTSTFQEMVVEACGDSSDPEVKALVDLVADPAAAIPVAILRPAHMSQRTVYLHHISDILTGVEDQSVLESVLEWLQYNQPYIEPHNLDRVVWGILHNPGVSPYVARAAAQMLSEGSAGSLLAHYRTELSTVARAAIVSAHPGARRSRDDRPSPRRQLAHALAEPVGWGFGAAGKPLLLALTPWLGTRMEETLGSLMAGWQGTAMELIEATAALEGTDVPAGLPRPVRRRRPVDEPPF